MSELSLYMHRALVDLHAAFPNRQAKRTCKRVRHMCTPGSTYLALHKTATYTCDGISPPFSLPYIFLSAPSPPPPNSTTISVDNLLNLGQVGPMHVAAQPRCT